MKKKEELALRLMNIKLRFLRCRMEINSGISEIDEIIKKLTDTETASDIPTQEEVSELVEKVVRRLS